MCFQTTRKIIILFIVVVVCKKDDDAIAPNKLEYKLKINDELYGYEPV